MCSSDLQKEKVTNCHGEAVVKRDYFFLTLLFLGVLFYFSHIGNEFYFNKDGKIVHLFHSFYELFNTMLWGIALGIIFVGLLGRVPREYIVSILGKPGTKIGLLRATFAGLLLDLCSHGILMVGMKLYERGASLGQTMAFLIASPWNSLSLTLILMSLVGIKWTLLFIVLSGIIAVISGLIFDLLEKKEVLPKNPNRVDVPENFKLMENLKRDIKKFNFSFSEISKILVDGVKDSKMIIKWVLFGALLSSALNVFVDPEIFKEYFGPSMIGLASTLVVTTILEEIGRAHV